MCKLFQGLWIPTVAWTLLIHLNMSLFYLTKYTLFSRTALWYMDIQQFKKKEKKATFPSGYFIS